MNQQEIMAEAHLNKDDYHWITPLCCSNCIPQVRVWRFFHDVCVISWIWFLKTVMEIVHSMQNFLYNLHLFKSYVYKWGWANSDKFLMVAKIHYPWLARSQSWVSNAFSLSAQLNQWNFINILFYASFRRLCSNGGGCVWLERREGG
jgi:hypothetical protein